MTEPADFTVEYFIFADNESGFGDLAMDEPQVVRATLCLRSAFVELQLPCNKARTFCVRGSDVLIGQGHELAAHHMEIRGVGLVDIPALFGARSVRQQKRIEVVVQLEDWENAKDADRTGLQRDVMTVLDVAIPKVIVPLNPGKNITVVAEVVAMMHLLRYSGVDVAAAFNERLIKKMREKRGVREYLRGDIE